MEYHRVGKSGLKITAITYGTALTIGSEVSNDDGTSELIQTAWDSGIRSFDTSNNYGNGSSERLLSRALKKYNRQDYVISTKGSWPVGEGVYYSGLSRKHILWAFSESIKNLDVQYVDIYYAHRYDPEVPISEVINTFNGLIDKGVVRYWATSDWPLNALQEVHSYCKIHSLEPPILDQFIFSYAVNKARTTGIIDFCSTEGIGMLGFSPLCQGLLTGKYENGVPVNSRIAKASILGYDKTKNFQNQFKDRIDVFLKVCAEYSIDPVAAALQWSLRNGVLPVVGASRPSQIASNVGSLSKIIPDDFWNNL